MAMLEPRVVATRVFRTTSGTEVLASVYEPAMVGPDTWTCGFKISGLARPVVAHGHGVDGMQALTNALEGLRVNLESSGETLTWLEAEPGDFGIPRPVPSSFGVAVERHLGKLLDDEVTRLVEAKKRDAGG